MHIQTNTSLKSHNTFGINVKAKEYCKIESVEQLKEALAHYKDQEVFVIGGGSNMLLRSDVKRPVLHIDMRGIEVVDRNEEEVVVRAMAGENWHQFVLWCLKHDFGGLENLSLIPGNVGAAPIQNIGAYGVEIKDHFVSCEALDIKSRKSQTFFYEDCAFAYRESVFKSELKGRMIITSVCFRLTSRNHRIKTSYGAIEKELKEMGAKNPSIQDVSKAVIAIRSRKLPDPKEIGNSGSFFKNPVISNQQYKSLKEQFPDIPGYVLPEGKTKVPAGWLIEKAGFKGKRFGDYGVHKNQALVLVNYDDASGKDIYNLALLIQTTIKRLFDICIELEVNII